MVWQRNWVGRAKKVDPDSANPIVGKRELQVRITLVPIKPNVGRRAYIVRVTEQRLDRLACHPDANAAKLSSSQENQKRINHQFLADNARDNRVAVLGFK